MSSAKSLRPAALVAFPELPSVSPVLAATKGHTSLGDLVYSGLGQLTKRNIIINHARENWAGTIDSDRTVELAYNELNLLTSSTLTSEEWSPGAPRMFTYAHDLANGNVW